MCAITASPPPPDQISLAGAVVAIPNSQSKGSGGPFVVNLNINFKVLRLKNSPRIITEGFKGLGILDFTSSSRLSATLPNIHRIK